jgi:hypothetical protein
MMAGLMGLTSDNNNFFFARDCYGRQYEVAVSVEQTNRMYRLIAGCSWTYVSPSGPNMAINWETGREKLLILFEQNYLDLRLMDDPGRDSIIVALNAMRDRCCMDTTTLQELSAIVRDIVVLLRTKKPTSIQILRSITDSTFFVVAEDAGGKENKLNDNANALTLTAEKRAAMLDRMESGYPRDYRDHQGTRLESGRKWMIQLLRQNEVRTDVDDGLNILISIALYLTRCRLVELVNQSFIVWYEELEQLLTKIKNISVIRLKAKPPTIFSIVGLDKAGLETRRLLQPLVVFEYQLGKVHHFWARFFVGSPSFGASMRSDLRRGRKALINLFTAPSRACDVEGEREELKSCMILFLKQCLKRVVARDRPDYRFLHAFFVDLYMCLEGEERFVTLKIKAHN